MRSAANFSLDVSLPFATRLKVKTLIVVVDDSRQNGNLLCRILRGAGYDSVDLLSGPELFGFLGTAARPDLIILDLMMPEMDGMECLTQIRKTPLYRDIPVVMFTADSSAAHQHDAKLLGAQEYMVKGVVRVEDLLSTIRKYAPQVNT